jgi:hypothetical protein
MVNQICVIGVIQGLAEGLNFGRWDSSSLINLLAQD